MEIEGGESLWSAKVKVADALVHGTQFTNVIDLVRMEYQRPRLDRIRRALPRLQILGPVIAANRRSVNGDRWWGIIVEREGEISGPASSRPAIHQCR